MKSFEDCLVGHFGNQHQAMKDPSRYAHINISHVKLSDGIFYGEQCYDYCPKDPYRQFILKVITVDKIQNVVSNYFNIPLNEMLSQRRSRPLARPRQIAMFLSKKMTARSLPEIGRRFANRDHTTVIHAVKTITRLSEQDDEMKKNINQIKSLLLE